MTPAEIKYRLSEIAATNFQNLSDEVVLALLAERKELLAEETRLDEEKQKENEQAKEQEMKKEALLTRLAEVNQGITSDQDSDKLLALIQERKSLEGELKAFPTQDQDTSKEEAVSEVLPEVVKKKSKKKVVESSVTLEEVGVVEVPQEEPVAPEQERTAVPEEAETLPEEHTITIKEDAPYIQTSHISESGKVSDLENLTEERVALDSSLQTTEFQGYLDELKNNLTSLGTFLQALPVEVKRNRAFMLEVAKFDPAYAMHYADKDTLKKDENFNVAIAGMNNQRNTGNPLSEMLPEMRTGAVLLAGVKNDFRNVRFVRPEMPEYEEIVTLARRGALEAATALKEAHSMKDFLPPVLQKDKAFMAQVQKLTNQA